MMKNHYSFLVALALFGIAIWALAIASSSSSTQQQAKEDPFQEEEVVIPKLAASHDDNVLNVHVVPHTHDDVGWLKTVEQYYYGFNNSIQHAHVQSILDSTISALRKNPNRTFTYVEMKFFSMWWYEQDDETKAAVKTLVQEESLSFVNGGWCMHDEAATHYMGMIDQTTLGHDFLKKQLDFVPTVGWQLDPFGHSSTQASYMTSLMGFDALYFGRIDYQDLALRHETQECEGLWSAPNNNTVGESVFWGLTGSYGGNYGPPSHFCFDATRCQDEPLVGLEEEHLLARIKNLVVDELKVQSDRTKGNHIMLTMGEDFNYENAEVYMKNLDVMIHSLAKFQSSQQIDVPSILGPRFDKINIFYSNPNYYTKQKMLETTTTRLEEASITGVEEEDSSSKMWSTKIDDFFPYADGPDAFWTGYFVSRTGFKRLERVASSFLMAARQIESYHPTADTSLIGAVNVIEDCNCRKPLYTLEDALGVSQHHDAVSGTAKQHVANDYAKRLQAGVNDAAEYAAKKMKEILLGDDQAADKYLDNLSYCQLLNESICEISQRASRKGDDIYVVVYNSLASSNRSSIVGIPVSVEGGFKVQRVGDSGTAEVTTTHATTSLPLHDGEKMVYFDTGPLPPTGAVAFKLTAAQASDNQKIESATQRSLLSTTTTKGSASHDDDKLKVEIDVDDDMSVIATVLTNDGTELDLRQRWGYYTSFDSSLDKPGTQNSGAYIFRPSEPDQQFKRIGATSSRRTITDFTTELHIEYEVPWLSEVFRVYKDKPYVEVEYKIGPIPVDDGRGKEIVTQYASNITSEGVFYTDSNGREFQKRVRSFRPSWDLNETQPVAGNYYPVNTAIYIEDEKKSLGILTDRSQGGTSLVDGSIELMVQRRTISDDGRGVDEPLNETDGGVTPYPPYGDRTRYGEGIVIRGKHRILLTDVGNSGARSVRSEMDHMFAEPLIFVGSAKRGTKVPFRQPSFSLTTSSLPDNVMLITFMHLPQEPKRSFLIRLGHQYANGEDENLSTPASVDLAAMVGGKVVACQEKTLSGNRNVAEWKKKRYDWTGEGSPPLSPPGVVRGSDGKNCQVELKPMQIRTFKIQVEV